MCTGGRLLADFVAGTDIRPGLPAELDEHLTTTVDGLWIVWAYKLARPVGQMFAPLTFGARYPVDARAKCRHRFKLHAAPDPRCTCGFHALSSRASADRILPHFQTRGVGDGVVALTVALSGRVLAFEWDGRAVLWRAERQTVVRVVEPGSLDPTRHGIEMPVFPPLAAGISRTPRYPGDPDGRPAVVTPAPPRDSGPVRLDLPVSAPVLQVCHDDPGWCAVSGAFEHAPRLLVLT